MSLDMQKSLFALALDRLGKVEPTNEVLNITLEANGVVVETANKLNRIPRFC